MARHPATDEIAAAAARLVVEEGLEYASAKRKALRQLGLGARTELPANEQVEDQVREHLQLFCADTQPAELRALRELALRWMQRLADFRPHLAGAVWRGTATAQSAVHLELYADDAKSAEIALINAGVDYEPADAPGAAVPVLATADRATGIREPVTLFLHLLEHDDLRGALKPDARGRSWRGDTAALQRLLEAA